MSLRRITVLSLLATTAFTLPAHAVTPQNSVAYKNAASTVVVVTPLKSEKDVDAVPFAVTVVDKNEIEEKQAASVDDVLRDVPNYYSAGGPVSVVEEPSLRGLSDRRIVIKVDGIRRNFRAQYGGRYFIDPFMIDRVEVVRGSNSAIDGSGAMAGTIQFFTPDVKRELAATGNSFGSAGAVGYQSVNKELSTMMSGYGSNGLVDLYAAGSYRSSDDIKSGYGTTIHPTDAEPKDALIKAGFNFSPTHRAEVRLSRYFDRSGMALSPFQPVDPTIGNPDVERESAVTDYSLRYNFSPENSLKDLINVNSTVYHSQYRINTSRNSDGRLDETDFKTTGEDTYNNAKLNYFGLQHTLTTGVEYFENKQQGRRAGATRALVGNGRDSNLGLYAQQETTLFDRLTVTPGIRFDHYELYPGQAGLNKADHNHWSPKIGADLRINENWSTYGSVASAFRTPTLTELYSTGFIIPPGTPGFPGGVNLLSNPNLKPETGLNKEIGVRYKKEGVFTQYDNFKVNVSVFQNDIDDYIEQIIGATTASYRNVTQARLRGLEIEGKYRIGQVGATFSAGTIRGTNETLDQPLADVPQNKYTLGLEYYALENTLTTGARMQLNDNQDDIAPGQPLITTTPASTTYDVYVSYSPDLAGKQKGSFRIDAGVDNIFDKGYNKHLAFIPEAGRNTKVTLNWKF